MHLKLKNRNYETKNNHLSAIMLLLALVAFMVKDFFFSKPDNTKSIPI